MLRHDTWPEEVEALRAFHFDVVTVDLTGGDRVWEARVLDVASVAFLLWQAGEDARPAYDAGIRWHLARLVAQRGIFRVRHVLPIPSLDPKVVSFD